MKLYATDDVTKSVHVAYKQFTHVLLNRGYTLIRPVFFKSSALDDLPMFQYASWISASHGQVTRWKEQGGVLIEQDTHPVLELNPDVTVMVECPYSMERLKRCNNNNAEYGVVPRPASWKTHEECIDLRQPIADVLQDMWVCCGGRQMTEAELADLSGFPVQHVRYMKNALKPVEHWHIQKRLAPERDEFVPAWDWLTESSYPRSEITKSGFKNFIEEMARFGYINLKRIHHYPTETPDWRKLEKKREEALSDLASVRLLVESLEAHPEM